MTKRSLFIPFALLFCGFGLEPMLGMQTVYKQKPKPRQKQKDNVQNQEAKQEDDEDSKQVELKTQNKYKAPESWLQRHTRLQFSKKNCAARLAMRQNWDQLSEMAYQKLAGKIKDSSMVEWKYFQKEKFLLQGADAFKASKDAVLDQLDKGKVDFTVENFEDQVSSAMADQYFNTGEEQFESWKVQFENEVEKAKKENKDYIPEKFEWGGLWTKPVGPPKDEWERIVLMNRMREKGGKVLNGFALCADFVDAVFEWGRFSLGFFGLKSSPLLLQEKVLCGNYSVADKVSKGFLTALSAVFVALGGYFLYTGGLSTIVSSSAAAVSVLSAAGLGVVAVAIGFSVAGGVGAGWAAAKYLGVGAAGASVIGVAVGLFLLFITLLSLTKTKRFGKKEMPEVEAFYYAYKQALQVVLAVAGPFMAAYGLFHLQYYNLPIWMYCGLRGGWELFASIATTSIVAIGSGYLALRWHRSNQKKDKVRKYKAQSWKEWAGFGKKKGSTKRKVMLGGVATISVLALSMWALSRFGSKKKVHPYESEADIDDDDVPLGQGDSKKNSNLNLGKLEEE